MLLLFFFGFFIIIFIYILYNRTNELREDVDDLQTSQDDAINNYKAGITVDLNQTTTHICGIFQTRVDEISTQLDALSNRFSGLEELVNKTQIINEEFGVEEVDSYTQDDIVPDDDANADHDEDVDMDMENKPFEIILSYSTNDKEPELVVSNSHVYFSYELRLFIEAVLWKLRTGAPWRDLPTEFGSHSTVFNKFNRWSNYGLWQEIFKELHIEKIANWLNKILKGK
jgi:transposase